MPRRARAVVGGVVYHVMNRACGRMRVFSRDADYVAFEEVVADALGREPVSLFSYCWMPNHFHMVVRPETDVALSRMMHWMTMTHTMRWRHFRDLVGLGPLYQGRFKAFAVQEDVHFLTVCRYVERNALRAGLVTRAEEWRWSSLHTRVAGGALVKRLAEWPVDAPGNVVAWVNRPQTDAEEADVRNRIRTGRPFGQERWERATSVRMGMTPDARPVGRPRKSATEA